MNNILITGGSGDIGAEIIKHLASKENRIFFTYYRNYKNANNLYKKIKKKSENIHFYKVSNSNQREIVSTIKKIKKKYGSIDILINNAGRSQIKKFTKISKADLDLIIDINLKGTFFWCQEVIKDMIKKKKMEKLSIFHRLVDNGEVLSKFIMQFQKQELFVLQNL